jgi:hypothetical protein
VYRRYLFAIALVISAPYAWIAWRGYGLLRLAAERETTFQAAPGTVTAASVETRRAGRGLAYAPAVRYRYVVGSDTLSGSQATVLDAAGSESWAAGIAARFHPGQRVTVFYNPARPGQSFLLPDTGHLAGWLIGSGLFLLGALLWAGRRPRGKQETDARASPTPLSGLDRSA